MTKELESRKNARCGDCRNFFPTGNKNNRGERMGYCDEFPCAGEISENICCQPPVSFHQKKTP